MMGTRVKESGVDSLVKSLPFGPNVRKRRERKSSQRSCKFDSHLRLETFSDEMLLFFCISSSVRLRRYYFVFILFLKNKSGFCGFELDFLGSVPVNTE